MSDEIVLGEWLFDEKEPPELADQDEWRDESRVHESGSKGSPCSVPREFLKEGHVHIRGKSGSGKSSRVVLPLVLQLMRACTLRWTLADGSRREAEESDPLVIIDLGGDKSLFHATKACAERLGRKFRFLGLDPNHSERFDPFQCIPDDGHRIIRICNLLLESFSLDNGLMYGGSYYSSRNLTLLLAVCEHLVSRKQSGQDISLRDVDRYLSNPKNADVKDSEQVKGIFGFLLRYPQLQPSRDDESINMRDAVLNREVVYAYLPAIAEATTARQIAGLLLHVTVNSAMGLYEEHEENASERPLPHTHIVIDEFHHIAGKAFESLLTGSRKFSISMYLANQTTESLVQRDLDLSSVVRDNCSLKLYQTVTGKRDIEELQACSGETTRSLKSRKGKESVRFKGRGAFGTESTTEQVTPVLSKREVLDVSATKGAMFAIIDDGLGHREPIPLMTTHHLPRGLYQKYRATALPDTSSLYRAGVHDLQTLSRMPSWHSAYLEPRKSRALTERLRRLRSLHARLASEYGADDSLNASSNESTRHQ